MILPLPLPYIMGLHRLRGDRAEGVAPVESQDVRPVPDGGSGAVREHRCHADALFREMLLQKRVLPFRPPFRRLPAVPRFPEAFINHGGPPSAVPGPSRMTPRRSSRSGQETPLPDTAA